MAEVGLFLGTFAFLGLIMERLVGKSGKAARRFPSCLTCGSHMTTVSLPKFMPGEVVNHLDKHGLPTAAASRFICPKGHYQLWYVPRFGNTESPFFLKEQL